MIEINKKEVSIIEAIDMVKDWLIDDYTKASNGEYMLTESGDYRDYYEERQDQVVWIINQIINEIDNMINENAECEDDEE